MSVTPPELELEEKAISEDVAAMLGGFDRQRRNLIPILQSIQERHSYLSTGAIELVAGHLNISASEVYGVATFYNQFRFHPPGKHQIKVCLGTACHVRGGQQLLEKLEEKLEISPGECTKDRHFSMDIVRCIGACGVAPVMVVDKDVHKQVKSAKMNLILKRYQG